MCKSRITAQALREYDLAMGRGRQAVREVAPMLYKPAQGKGAQALRPPGMPLKSSTPRSTTSSQLAVDVPARQVQCGDRCLGFGKITLAFDIPFWRGQRRYLESPNAYARSIAACGPSRRSMRSTAFRPPVAIEQRLSRGGRKSTGGHDHRGLALSASAVRQSWACSTAYTTMPSCSRRPRKAHCRAAAHVSSAGQTIGP